MPDYRADGVADPVDRGRNCHHGAVRSQVVRAVKVDRIDLVERNEARDLDGTRLVVQRDRLEVRILDHHELALGDLPALDDLVRPDLALVGRAPALLPDRGLALPVERAEADVRLLRLRRGRQSQANGDVDEAEGNGSVPDSAHDRLRIVEGPGRFSLG